MVKIWRFRNIFAAMFSQEFIIDTLGWIGGVMVIVAYYLISSGRAHAKSFFFQALNLLGSIFLIVNTYVKGAYPSTVVNIVWVGIALYGFYRIFSEKK